MVMGDAGVTAPVMVGEVRGRWRRGSRSYSYVGGFFRAFPPERITWKAVEGFTLYSITSQFKGLPLTIDH